MSKKQSVKRSGPQQLFYTEALRLGSCLPNQLRSNKNLIINKNGS